MQRGYPSENSRNCWFRTKNSHFTEFPFYFIESTLYPLLCWSTLSYLIDWCMDGSGVSMYWIGTPSIHVQIHIIYHQHLDTRLYISNLFLTNIFWFPPRNRVKCFKCQFRFGPSVPWHFRFFCQPTDGGRRLFFPVEAPLGRPHKLLRSASPIGRAGRPGGRETSVNFQSSVNLFWFFANHFRN